MYLAINAKGAGLFPTSTKRLEASEHTPITFNFIHFVFFEAKLEHLKNLFKMLSRMVIRANAACGGRNF